MIRTDSIECLQACTVSLTQGSDVLGPSVGIAGVLLGGLIGFLGLRWQQRQNHRQFVLLEVARMTSALRDGWEIAAALRSQIQDPEPIISALKELEALAKVTGPTAETIGLISPGPVADKASHANNVFKTLVSSANATTGFQSQYWAESTESVWQLMNELTELAGQKYAR